ncbi:PadR family transcriptional regulator [Paraburkholderia sp. D15]|uniref:PadR family transcriptional regulator n=1 Tax=Paraburkholderia sp. D15 TaxID=2880218 RepID=UPI00247956B9|nr:PadR family transcriptional regulator [Paraburkholderia sp. D15]WGS52957.1 PadR family transcriptional regulator [Paraburkholderia sp. D15]
MRHHHRFSRSHHSDDSFHGHPQRASLHALWHAFMRDADFAGSDGSRGPRGRHAFHDHADHHGRRGHADSHGDAHPHGRHGHDRFSLHALWHAIGRHHEHRGGDRGGRFGGGGGGGFNGDGEGFPRGRKFTSDDLQLLLLSLIDAQPSHGYELIKALETRSNGFYTPSPGMVYPALTYLEEIGYVTVQLEGNRKRYALSETGRDYLSTNRDRVELMFAKLNHFARKMDSVRRAFAGEEPADISEGGWLPELTEARRKLKNLLVLRGNAPAEEQRRIAVILMRAAREIESHPNPANPDTPNTGSHDPSGEPGDAAPKP